MTTSRLHDRFLSVGLPERAFPSSPAQSQAATVLVQTQAAPTIQDSVSASLPGSLAIPPASVAFVDGEPAFAVSQPTAGIRFPDQALRQTKPLTQLQLIQALIQEQGQAQKLTQSIEQHQAAVVLLERIHLSLDLGMSLEDAFEAHFDPVDLAALGSFEHLLKESHVTAQQLLQLLVASARSQQAEPTAADGKIQGSDPESTARQLAGEVVKLSDELEVRSTEMSGLLDSSSQKRQQATVASKALQTLKSEEAVQEQQIQVLSHFIQQVAGGALASCRAFLPHTSGGASAGAAGSGSSGSAGAAAPACAALPPADLLDQWGIAVTLPGEGAAVFAVAGQALAGPQLLVYLTQEEQKQQDQLVTHQRAIQLKQSELKQQQSELALFEPLLSDRRKGLAVLAQKLEQKRTQLRQSPAAAQLPDYADLLARSGRALAHAEQLLARAEQESVALQHALKQLQQQLGALASQAHKAAEQKRVDQPAERKVPLPVTETGVCVPEPSPALRQTQAWDLAFLAKVEAENLAIDKQHAREFLAQLLNQQVTDLQLLRITEAKQYQQAKRDLKWAA